MYAPRPTGRWPLASTVRLRHGYLCPFEVTRVQRGLKTARRLSSRPERDARAKKTGRRGRLVIPFITDYVIVT